VGAAPTIRDDLTPSAPRRQARHRPSRRAAPRLPAVADAPVGLSRAEAARLAGMERRAPRDAVVRHDAQGLAGPRDRPEPGRPPAAGRGRAGRLGRARLRRARPGPGRHGGVDPRRPGRLARGPLRRGVPPARPVAGAEAPRPVPAGGAAGPPRGRPEGAGALPREGLRDAPRAAADPGKRVAPWSMDEARVGQKGRPCRRWRVRGPPPPGRRDRRCLFAAVEPATGADVAPVPPAATTAAVDLSLAEFAAGPAGDVRAPPRSRRRPARRSSTRSGGSGRACASACRHRGCPPIAVADACRAARDRLAAEPGRPRSPCDQPWIRKVSP
jgi:hypothetical protein